MKKTKSDCRAIDGITIGLIDSIITSLHLLSERDLSPTDVNEAIDDLLDHKLFIQFSNTRLDRTIKELNANLVVLRKK